MSETDSEILIAVPTLNEARNIQLLLTRLCQTLPNARIVVIDDSSPDGTAAIVRRFALEHPRVSVICRPHRLGIGSAHKMAIEIARTTEAKTLVTLDADLTHNPEDLPRLIRSLDHAEIAVGSRFLPSGGLVGWTLWRRLLTNLGHAATRRILGIPHDATGALRAYRVCYLEALFAGVELSNSYSWFYESLTVAHQRGARIVETPIVLTARTYGSSKMRVRDIVFGAANLLHFRRKLRQVTRS